MSTSKQSPVLSGESSASSQALTRLKPERVQDGLKKLPNWRQSRDGKSLVRTFKFATDRAPLAFAELVLSLAAKKGPQPTLTLANGTVQCMLTTPAAGGITRRDLELARRISTLG